MYEPKYMRRWVNPEAYFGEQWPEYYVFLSQHRESDTLTRSNFTCGLEAIGGESDTVVVVHERHALVGWVEWIGIHCTDDDALEAADTVLKRLDAYPVVNEDHWSDLEWEEAQEAWKNLDIRGRIELCASAGVSIFAARRDWIPEEDTGYIKEQLIGF